MLHWSVTSNRNLLRARVEAQQPISNDPFKSHFISPCVAAGEIRGANALVPTLCVTSRGRLRATLPKDPKALPANRHTVRQQDRDDRPRQRVMIARVSAESQSESPSSRQEPHRRICAVLWSWLSHRNSKETSAGARTSPAHCASFWREVKYKLKGWKMLSIAEIPSTKRPTEGPLWSLNSLYEEYSAVADNMMSEQAATRTLDAIDSDLKCHAWKHLRTGQRRCH